MPPSSDSPASKRKNVCVSGASVGILADALITQLHLSDDAESISSVTLPASALHKGTQMQAVADGRYGLVSSTHASGKVSSTPIMFVKSISEQLTGEQKATASKEMQLEALALRKLNSEYVMSAIGIVPEGDTMQPHHLLLTMYKHGNMRDFLQAIALSDSFSDATLPGAFRVSMAVDGARGLEYLHRQNIVLKDVGTRSFLVGENYHVVVGDLGLPSRFGTEDYWTRTAKVGAAVPVRWLAPEVMAIAAKDPVSWVLPAPGSPMRRVLCEASDVWSFGVTMWEIGSFAELPYLTYTTQKVISSLKKGTALPLGERANFPAQLMDPIRWCMSRTATDRPTFSELLPDLVVLHQTLLQENPVQAIQGRELPAVVTAVKPLGSDDPNHQYESVNYAALNSSGLTIADVPAKKKKWGSQAKSPKTTPKLKKKAVGKTAKVNEVNHVECSSPKSPKWGAPPSPKPPPRFDPSSAVSSAASTPSTSLIEGTNVNAHSFVNDDILDALVATLDDASNANAFTETVMKIIPRSMSADTGSGMSSPGAPDGLRTGSDGRLSDGPSPTVFTPGVETKAALLQSISGAYTKTIDDAEKAAGPGLMKVANSSTEANRRSALGPPPGYNAAPTYEEPVASNPAYMSASAAMAGRQNTDDDGDGQYGVVLTADGRVVDMSAVAADGNRLHDYNPYVVDPNAPPVEDNYTAVINASVNQQALSEARNRNVQHVAEIKARRKQGGAHVSGTSMLSDLDLPKDPLAEEDAYTQVVNDEVNEEALEIARGLNELKKEHRRGPSHLSVS